MEYQFENIQQYDQKMYLEFLYKIPYRKALSWGEAWLLIAIKDIYMTVTGDPHRWLLAALSLAIACSQLFKPYFKEKERAREYFGLYGGDDSPARVYFGDIIRIEDHTAVMHMDYGQIRQIIVLKRGMFLRYQENAYLAINPNCFARGTFAEFKQFLRQKRPDLKIPD